MLLFYLATVTKIDSEEWSALDVDVKGAAFEGLLEKAASEGKKGAGQYFTPQVLIKSIVRLMKPDPRVNPDIKICDIITTKTIQFNYPILKAS